jgi:hypothetical protein
MHLDLTLFGLPVFLIIAIKIVNRTENLDIENKKFLDPSLSSVKRRMKRNTQTKGITKPSVQSLIRKPRKAIQSESTTQRVA